MRPWKGTLSGAEVRRVLVAGVAATSLALTVFVSTGGAEPSRSSSPVNISGAHAAGSLHVVRVEARPKRETLDPGDKRVSYRLYTTNMDKEPSGVVRLCARKWPHGRLRLLGERCEAFASVDPGESALRLFKFRVLDRARGKLSEIRLRARGPEVQPAATTVLLKVRRRAAPPPDPYPY